MNIVNGIARGGSPCVLAQPSLLLRSEYCKQQMLGWEGLGRLVMKSHSPSLTSTVEPKGYELKQLW